MTVLIESHNEMSKVHMASCHHTTTGWSYGDKAHFRLYRAAGVILCVSNIGFVLYVYDFLSLFLFDTLVKNSKNSKKL